MKTKTVKFENFTKQDKHTAALAYKMTFHVLDIVQVILPIYENIFRPAQGEKMRLNNVYSAITFFEKCLKSKFIELNNSAEELNIVQEDNDEIFELVKAYCSISLSKFNREKLKNLLKDFNKKNEIENI